MIIAPETCDDGNTESNDGCSNTCTTEEGFDCTEFGCSPICGDGLVVGTETCDDGNAVSNDGCSSTCEIEDTGSPNTIWVCDPPNQPCKEQCASPRIRKPWTSYTAAEQDTYVRAVEVAMEEGLYAIFVGIHIENANSAQAHGTCGFLGWHRKYLLAYENMLRMKACCA